MPVTPTTKNAKQSEYREKYGLKFMATDNDLAIELGCYRDPKTFPTGKPREFHFTNAWRLVWPAFQFNAWTEMMIWAWCNYRVIGVMGSTRGGKTYTFAHVALLDYMAADFMTASSLVTTKFEALRARMWGDLCRAIEAINPSVSPYFVNRYRLVSSSNEMKLVINDSKAHGTDKFMIQGVAADSGDTAAGKLRGQHADRRRIFTDEAQDVPDAVYMAIENARSAPDFRAVLLSNPVEKNSQFGKWTEPKAGWSTVSYLDDWWETVQPNGICLHLDGTRSPNVMAGKTIFPYLITKEYIDEVRASKGVGSLEDWMFNHGFFPPDGLISRIWPSGAIERAKQIVEFDYKPTKIASFDPAYEHDDRALTIAELGVLRNGKPCVQILKQIEIPVKEGPNEPLKDRQIADAVMRICRDEEVAPENYIQDTTGNGRSVFALLYESWSPKIQKVEYGGEATNRPLRLNDPKPANEQVRYFVAELWFRAAYMAADGLFAGFDRLHPKCDLSARRYTIRQTGDRKLMVAETKEELKKRINRSPDFEDSLVQLGELVVRKGLLGNIPGFSATQANQWNRMKKLAIKAASRWAEKKEFSSV